MIAFIADIHGNLAALEAVMEKLNDYNISTIYSIGDVAGYYPQINECIDLLIENNVAHIMGNHDNYLVNNIDCSRSTKVNQAISYQRSIITQDNLLWLKASSKYIDSNEYIMIHGGIHDYFEEYSDASVLLDIDKYLFICGHTHIQEYTEKYGKRFLNPGSIGQPRDKDPRAAYAILHDDRMLLCRTEYDISRTEKATRDAGFPSSFWEGLYTGESIGAKAVDAKAIYAKAIYAKAIDAKAIYAKAIYAKEK